MITIKLDTATAQKLLDTLRQLPEYNPAALLTIHELETRLRYARPKSRTCPVCGSDVYIPANGRKPVYCSSRCKQRAYRQRKAAT